MRNEEEIKMVLEKLDRESATLHPTGDNFRYGYLMGKMTALEWVLGNAPSSDIGIHFDFEDWMREIKEVGEEVRAQLKDAKKPPS